LLNNNLVIVFSLVPSAIQPLDKRDLSRLSLFVLSAEVGNYMEKNESGICHHLMCYLLIPVAVCIYVGIVIWKQRRINREFVGFAHEHGCQPPRKVDSSFFSGVAHKWKRLNQRGDVFNDYMNKVFKDNSSTHAIVDSFSGSTKALYTIEPENVKTMLSTKFSDYHRPRTMPNALDPVMGQGVFTSNGAAWAHSRGLVRAQFSLKRVRNVEKLEQHVQNAFVALGKPGRDGWTDEREILLIFNRFTLDSATEFMFGTSAGSHEAYMKDKEEQRIGKPIKGILSRYKAILDDFAIAFDIALDYVALRLKLGRLWFLADSITFRLACCKVKSYVDSYIREAVVHADTARVGASGKKLKEIDVVDDRRYGLISELVDSYPDKTALRNQVMQLLVAGRDTTAATLTWAFILLEAHPDVYSRLHGEIEVTFGTDKEPHAPVTFENLRSCTYLQHVVTEVVRLYPTGPLNARKATVNTVLPVGGGADGKASVAVKAGTTVAYNTYLMHRAVEHWGADAWGFKPERWEGRRAGWEYIPFHGGPQTCLGREFRSVRSKYCRANRHIRTSCADGNGVCDYARATALRPHI
jgi:cytochrome P450